MKNRILVVEDDTAISELICMNLTGGQRPHLAHDFAKQSVVCYTLCRRCRENTVANREGEGHLKRQESRALFGAGKAETKGWFRQQAGRI